MTALPFRVRGCGAVTVPNVVWKYTMVPSCTAAPPATWTVAVIVAAPLSEMVVGDADSVIVESAGASSAGPHAASSRSADARANR